MYMRKGQDNIRTFRFRIAGKKHKLREEVVSKLKEETNESIF